MNDISAQSCSDDDVPLGPFTLMIYGGGGDLSLKKLLPNIYTLYRQHMLPQDFSVICAGSPRDTDVTAFRELARRALEAQEATPVDPAVWQGFAAHLDFMFLRFEDDASFDALAARARDRSPHGPDRTVLLHFLAVPPRAFPEVIRQIGRTGLNQAPWDARLIIEKPFGTDLASAHELNAQLRSILDEDRIYRIDHYLGKETVQNILFFRFANSIFEPLWNNKYIDHVQITVAEDIGIEKRGKFYENSGVIRDIIQNHAMQLLALVAMEPPVNFDAEAIRDEKAKVCRSLVPIRGEDVARRTVVGQYAGAQGIKSYREEDFVAPDSRVPTFFAGEFRIQNWRWAGVPFYVRAGKRLGVRQTDIVIQFKRAPMQFFNQCQDHEPGTLRLSIQPKERITLSYEVKFPNTVKRVWPVHMTFDYENTFAVQSLPAYARLIHDALKGDLSLFVRQDGIEAMWDFIDPIISWWEGPGEPPLPYAPGSDGPPAARDLVAAQGHAWRTPIHGEARR